jgi:hypothetical protein
MRQGVELQEASPALNLFCDFLPLGMELACFLRMVCQLIHFWFNVAHIAGLVAFLYLLPPRLGCLGSGMGMPRRAR